VGPRDCGSENARQVDVAGHSNPPRPSAMPSLGWRLKSASSLSESYSAGDSTVSLAILPCKQERWHKHGKSASLLSQLDAGLKYSQSASPSEPADLEHKHG
jgi:hypothetical protein